MKGVNEMNYRKIKQEGQAWVDGGIITEDQLERIVATYTKKDSSVIIILFAILLTGLGILTFIFSEWAQVPHFSRTIIMITCMMVLYILGDILFRTSSTMLGISFVILGYIAFGASLLLTIDIYGIVIQSAWPFIIWGVLGLLLYVVYENQLLFVIGVVITTFGQIFSGFEFRSFNMTLLLILIIGFAYFVYNHSNVISSYIFSVGFILQMLTLTITEAQQYYWMIVYILILYVAGDLIKKEVLKQAFKNISLLSIFIFAIYQTFLLQESFFMGEIEYRLSFFIVWGVLIGLACAIKFWKQKKFDWIDFLLFVPLFILPYAYLIGLMMMFGFSIGRLFIGYHRENHKEIMVGTIGFLLSTFAVYIQYAWESMNKSLFFLIGGILLFIIGFFLEKQRRSFVEDQKGGENK